MTTRHGPMQESAADPQRADRGRSALTRNLMLVAGYLAILTLIALGYGA